MLGNPARAGRLRSFPFGFMYLVMLIAGECTPNDSMKWQCPRCGTDLTDLVLGGKVVLSRIEDGHGSAGRLEGEIQCPSCAKLVKPELITSP